MTVRVYLDSAPLIYLVENVAPFVESVIAELSAPDVVQVCSELSRLECRVKPMRDGDEILLAAYDSYFTDIVAEIVPLSRTVMDQATELRARYNFRTPDALHLACAISYQCDLFLTNDRQLQKCQEISVAVLESHNEA